MSAITAFLDPALAVGPSPIQPFPSQLPTVREAERPDSFSPFSSFFDAAMNVMNDTNAMVRNFQNTQLDFATGRLDDILAVQTAMDRANNAMNFTSQVTTRIIEAYREIMRMQI